MAFSKTLSSFLAVKPSSIRLIIRKLANEPTRAKIKNFMEQHLFGRKTCFSLMIKRGRVGDS